MKLWPPFGKTENRASATDIVTAALVAQASGTAPPSIDALGAVETAAGLYARSFSTAIVSPQTPATAGLTPSILGSIGRQLATRGECVYVLEFSAGAIQFRPADTWEVIGGGIDPAGWRYRVDLAVPSGRQRRTLSADELVHIRYGVRPSAPWRGLSPLHFAADTRALAAWMDKRLGEEAATSAAYVLPLPEGRGDSTDLKADLKKGSGRLHLVDTVAGGYGSGPVGAPAKDWVSTRLGFDPPTAIVNLRKDVRMDVLAAYGVPNQIFGSGGAARESFRQFLASALTPVGKVIAEALSGPLEVPDLAFGFEDLRAADLAGIGRALKALVDSGVPLAEAMPLVGLE